jgi:hypothetical protein
MQNRLGIFLGVLGLASLVLSCGCSKPNRPQMAKVSGKITYQGKPVDGAQVTFNPTGPSPRAAIGTTDAQGRFDLTTFDTGDGAVVGEHVVTITKPEAQAAGQGMSPDKPDAGYGAAMMGAAQGATGPPKPATTLPAKYATKETSPEKRTVAAEGPNTFNIELKD